MTLLTLIIVSVALYGLIRATDAVDHHWATRRTPKPAKPAQRLLWLPSGTGCRGCGSDEPRDVWLPHLCYECAELVRVNARINHYKENNG